MQEETNGVKRVAVFLLPVWVSWTALTKGPNQGRGRELEYPSHKLLMICPRRIQVPEVNLISSTQPRITGEDPSQGMGRWPPRLPPAVWNTSVCAGAQGPGGLRPAPSPSFTSGSTLSFPSLGLCPG